MIPNNELWTLKISGDDFACLLIEDEYGLETLVYEIFENKFRTDDIQEKLSEKFGQQIDIHFQIHNFYCERDKQTAIILFDNLYSLIDYDVAKTSNIFLFSAEDNKDIFYEI